MADDIAKAERQIRLLERKLRRSEESRVNLEKAKDRFDSLYTTLLADLNEQKALLADKNRTLEALSAKLSKYLSPQVYQSIFTGKQDASLVTRRKKLTIFFSDIQDFTRTTEDLQAEDLTFILNDYFTEMSKLALEHGATIDKFIGDAMLMFFGDPESKGTEEDARACVRMAVAMQRRMRRLQAKWNAMGYERPFRMRIGVNTGYCNVGNFGSPDRMDYTIIGGEVNLTARLQTAADADGILLSFETYVLVRDTVDAEEREPILAKGIRSEVRPFTVTSIFADEQEREQVLRVEDHGVAIRLDLAKLTDDSRSRALAALERAAERLRRGG
ncbi:adenylate/guanylate cyclase domain-containing protein [Reyranella sp.]|uniref:adenylate/guanylate cyclase domain-containing protein n=1 Tax=Reyranella sp. TaxID=1929291 RepID=UPI003D108845